MRSENNASTSRIQRARREDVVAAAVTVLDADGFAAASVEKIARQAGTSKGTVLYHFSAKEKIYEAVVDELFAVGAAYMTQRVGAVHGPRAKLHEYVASNLRFIAEHRAHVHAVHRIQQGRGLEIGPDAVTPLRDLLVAGQEAGELGTFDPEVVALVVRALVDGASFHFTARPGLDVEHYVAEAVQIVDRATGGVS